jgi:hypothetical protein
LVEGAHPAGSDLAHPVEDMRREGPFES